MIIRYKKLHERAVEPSYQSTCAAGADLYALLDGDVTLHPGETAFLHTGIAVEIPDGYAGLVFARSGLACKRDLAPANKVGVIDSDYRGEILIALHNHGKEEQTVTNGERIAQLVIVPFLAVEFEQAEQLHTTERGSGGFGSTGKQ